MEKSKSCSAVLSRGELHSLPLSSQPNLFATNTADIGTSGVYQTPAADAEEVTQYAIQEGYRHVDSATAYRNEQPSCTGMLKAGVPREQLFFTSKVPPKCINYKDARDCVDESLKKTGLSYIDLYLLHAPYGGKEGRLGAWQALAEAAQEGKVRSIGVSNYGVQHLQELEDWQNVSLFSSLATSLVSCTDARAVSTER